MKEIDRLEKAPLYYSFRYNYSEAFMLFYVGIWPFAPGNAV
jgi:hypothetical protein